MAIYSLNLASIGRTTHAAGTAGAHLLYIGRQSAASEIVAAHMPADPQAARMYINQAEDADRKNARVIDKLRLALPRELDATQRAELVQAFAEEITRGRTPWFAAFHQGGKDVHNPHCHLVIRDRDIETGKRVARLSDSPRDRQKAGLEPKAVEWVRSRWEHHANDALERAGHEVRIDRRSLEAQGVEREPTIHIGPRAQHVDKAVQRPTSKSVTDGRGRCIDYEIIDAGRTRRERHGEIVDLNLEKAARSADFETRERARFMREQVAKDRALESRLMETTRRATLTERRSAADLRQALSEAKANATDELKATRAQLRADWKAKSEAVKTRQSFALSGFNAQHGRVLSRLWRAVDPTGSSRKAYKAAREALERQQQAERKQLLERHRRTKAALVEAVQARAAQVALDIKRDHASRTGEARRQAEEAKRLADAQRQARAAEREAATRQFEANLARAKQARKAQELGRGREFGLER